MLKISGVVKRGDLINRQGARLYIYIGRGEVARTHSYIGQLGLSCWKDPAGLVRLATNGARRAKARRNQGKGAQEPNRKGHEMMTERDLKNYKRRMKADRKTPRGRARFTKYQDYYDYIYMRIRERVSKGENVPVLDRQFLGYYELYKSIG